MKCHLLCFTVALAYNIFIYIFVAASHTSYTFISLRHCDETIALFSVLYNCLGNEKSLLELTAVRFQTHWNALRSLHTFQYITSVPRRFYALVSVFLWNLFRVFVFFIASVIHAVSKVINKRITSIIFWILNVQ